MKQKLISRTIFISKSLAWSVLFYFTAMAIINWEEYSKRGSVKSWVIREHNGDKELIPVKVIMNDNASSLNRLLKLITKSI